MEVVLDVLNLMAGSVLAAQANEDYNSGRWWSCSAALIIGAFNMWVFVT